MEWRRGRWGRTKEMGSDLLRGGLGYVLGEGDAGRYGRFLGCTLCGGLKLGGNGCHYLGI